MAARRPRTRGPSTCLEFEVRPASVQFAGRFPEEGLERLRAGEAVQLTELGQGLERDPERQRAVWSNMTRQGWLVLNGVRPGQSIVQQGDRLFTEQDAQVRHRDQTLRKIGGLHLKAGHGVNRRGRHKRLTAEDLEHHRLKVRGDGAARIRLLDQLLRDA